jgi:glutathione S-transferase
VQLIGQYDSPFARRVAITMTLYGLAFTHNRWSVFGNANELAQVNPLIRVPTLVLDSGEALVETSAIIDYLDSLVDPDQRLLPQSNPARMQALKVVSIASGVSDMAVRMFYEIQLHKTPSTDYLARITKQLEGALTWLEGERAARHSETWLGGRMTQADIAVTCTMRHLGQAFPHLAAKGRYPALEKHCAHFEGLAVFKMIYQEFIPPT